jgi:hypothetical protein
VKVSGLQQTLFSEVSMSCRSTCNICMQDVVEERTYIYGL